MEHHVAPGDGPGHRLRVGQVAVGLLDAELGQPRVRGPGEGADGVAAGEELADDRPAEEPAAAGDQGLHRYAPAGSRRQALSESAQGASRSRKIFELCRTSTGKTPW